MNHPTDPTNDPQADEHRAKVDALLAGTPAPPPQKPAAARAPEVDGEVAVPAMVTIEGGSQIAAHGYDAETGHLFLRFHGKGGSPGPLYRYANFGATDYQAFVDAESKGGYLARVIKPNSDRYPCERVPE